MVMKFTDLPTTRKGRLGEELVNEYLIEQGYIPYSPDVDKAHPFDRIVASADKRKIFVAECKAKPARTHYPDTGIDVKHYNEYKYLEETYGINVFLFFIDEDQQKIYGNWLTVLETPQTIKHRNKTLNYPWTHGKQIYFPLDAMEHISYISEQYVAQLANLSTRNSIYKQ